MGSRVRQRKAFTIVELVTVIVILGILSVAAAGPVLTYMVTVRGGAAASRLAADIRFMQRMSLSSGLRTWIAFDQAGQRYQLYCEDQNNPGKLGRIGVVHPAEQTSAAIQLNSGPYAGITMTSLSINSTTELEFDSFGAPYDGNSAALSASAQVQLSTGTSVVVQPVTGMVEKQ